MLHGIENIGYNNQGYIFWKDQQIEHFDHPTDPKMAKPTKELERRCILLEKRGAVINCTCDPAYIANVIQTEMNL